MYQKEHRVINNKTIMKYLCLFIVFVFYSCASTSYKPIEQFLIEEMKKENKKKFVLISQKKPFLAFYYIYKGIPVPNKPFSDEKQQLSDEIYKKYKNEREKKRWRKNDFKKLILILWELTL
jgi:Tfp pilus assembly protein PilP